MIICRQVLEHFLGAPRFHRDSTRGSRRSAQCSSLF
jgi:hypothetical protein